MSLTNNWNEKTFRNDGKRDQVDLLGKRYALTGYFSNSFMWLMISVRNAGLERNTSAPDWMAADLSEFWASADIIILGISAVIELDVSYSQTAKPSIHGSMTSSTVRYGFSEETWDNPLMPCGSFLSKSGLSWTTIEKMNLKKLEYGLLIPVQWSYVQFKCIGGKSQRCYVMVISDYNHVSKFTGIIKFWPNQPQFGAGLLTSLF